DQDRKSAVGPHRKRGLANGHRSDVITEVRRDVDRSSAPVGGGRTNLDRLSETLAAVVRANDLRVYERMRRPNATQPAANRDVAVVAVRGILPQRIGVGHLDGRAERRTSVQRTGDEDGGVGRRNAACAEGGTDRLGYKDLAIRAEHGYGTLLQRPGVATVGNGVRLF